MTSRWFTNSFVRRDQEQYAKKMKKPKGATLALKRGYIDIHFFERSDVKALGRRFGQLAQLALMKIYLSMSGAERARIEEDALLDILDAHGVTDHAGFIDYCLDENRTLIKLYREISHDESGNIPTQSPDEVGFSDNESDNDSDIDIGSKDLENTAGVPSQVVASAAAPETPAWLEMRFHTPIIRKFLPLVIAKLRANRRTFAQVEFEANFMQFDCDIGRMERALMHTAALTDPYNLNEPGKYAAPARASPPKKLSSHEKALELLKKIQTEDEDETRGTFEIDGGDRPGTPAAIRRIGGPT